MQLLDLCFESAGGAEAHGGADRGRGRGYSLFPEAILEVTAADFGIAGDGEVALAQLAEALAGKTVFGRVAGLV